MKNEISNIISLLQCTFEKGAWHGSSVKEMLKDISSEQSLKRVNNTHSIIELVAHMTAWRIFVAKRLEGDIEFKMTEELNFPSLPDWALTLQQLEDSQIRLLSALEEFPESRLPELVTSSTHQYSFYALLHGIIHHDLYHIGQIALIKKSTSNE